MSDLIQRQAVIDALGERPMVWTGSDYELGARNQYDADVLAIETVPAAQSFSCDHENDTISRQAAIEAVSKGCRELRGIFGMCEENILALPSAQPEQQWIPCSERLPKEDGNYLVTFEEGYAEDYGFDSIGIAPFEVDCEGFGIWQEEFDRYTLGSLGSDWVEIKVIAWMPLPEPYKEASE